MSFTIIENEAGDHGFNALTWPIVRRMIHTSADFEYIETIRFHEKAIEAGTEAIKKGCSIITDTNMAKAGIRKTTQCFIKDNDVAKIASENDLIELDYPYISNIGRERWFKYCCKHC